MTRPLPMASVDGALVPLAEARVSVLDQGFRTGEGVFETLRAYTGHPFRLAAHLARAQAGADRLGFALPSTQVLTDAVRTTVEANRDLSTDLTVRLTVTPGPLDPASPWPPRPLGTPTVVVTAHALHVPDRVYADGVTAVTVPGLRELADVKAVSHLAASLARRHARDAGAHEALLVDDAGHVLEGAGSNVFGVRGTMIVTPPTDGGLLAGVTRATVLAVAPDAGLAVVEEDLTVGALQAADEVFLTASTQEVVPLVRLDGHQVGSGRPGPVSRTLLAAYRDAVDRERHQG